MSEFAAVEADSAWQYLNALSHTSDPVTERALFESFCEELEHAAAFSALAAGARPRPAAARKPLVTETGDLPFFLAYVRESERNVARRFAAYAHALEGGAMGPVFARIAEEELGHDDAAWGSLVAMCGSEAAAESLCRRARFKRGWEGLERASQRIGDVMGSVWLSLLYLAAGPFARPYCRRARAQRAGAIRAVAPQTVSAAAEASRAM